MKILMVFLRLRKCLCSQVCIVDPEENVRKIRVLLKIILGIQTSILKMQQVTITIIKLLETLTHVYIRQFKVGTGTREGERAFSFLTSALCHAEVIHCHQGH